MNNFGIKLKYYRKQSGATQEQLAEKLGVSSNFIRQIEAGDKLPRLENFEKIPLLFGVPADCLLKDIDKEYCLFAIAGLMEKLRGKDHEQLKTIIEVLEAIDSGV